MKQKQPWKTMKNNSYIQPSLVDIELKDTACKGKGLFALRNFEVGEVICLLYGKNSDNCLGFEDYAIGNNDDSFIIPTDLNKPNGFHANNSCNANAAFHSHQDAIVCYKNIKRGDEITVYYGWRKEYAVRCRCDAKLCTGNIGSYHTLSDTGQYIIYPDQSIALLTAAICNKNIFPLHHLNTLLKTSNKTVVSWLTEMKFSQSEIKLMLEEINKIIITYNKYIKLRDERTRLIKMPTIQDAAQAFLNGKNLFITPNGIQSF